MMLRRILIAMTILAVVGGVTLFILDQTVFAPVAVRTAVPVAPTLSVPTRSAATQPAGAAATPTQASAGDASATAQLYRIDAAQSEVRYEVGETFFQGNRFAVAIGRTRGIAGDIYIDFATPANSQIGQIVIDVSQFTSDESRRDNYIRRSGLESSRYPYATFQALTLEGLPAQVAQGDEVMFRIVGDLTVKETTRPVTWEVTLRVEAGRMVGAASTEILMSDFGVGPIQVPILATEDNVTLFFDFVALPVEGA